jgi:hypothetical protein
MNELEITIPGLNAQQRVLADIIWACESKDKVDAFIRALPTRALRNEAQSIVDLMLMAVVEQCYDGISEMDAAAEVLQKYNKKKG